MAQPDEHLEQARRNLAVANDVLRDRPTASTYVQWAVTAGRRM
jgi:hypothetical protein